MSFGCPGGSPLGFWLRLGRLHFKSRRQRSERQSAEPFRAAASHGSYRLKAPSVDIRARAADLPSPRRRSVPRRSNSNSTRPRNLCPWRRAGPRSCAERRSAGAVIPGLRARARASSLASSLKACFESCLRSCRFVPPSCVRWCRTAVPSAAGSSGTLLLPRMGAQRRLMHGSISKLAWLRGRRRRHHHGPSSPNKIARVGLRTVRMTPLRTREEKIPPRTQKKRATTGDRKDPQFEGPFLFRDALRIADARFRPRHMRRAPTSSY